MFVSYRITAAVIALLLGTLVFRLVRRNQLHVSYSLWWLSAGGVAVLAGLFPTIFDELGHAFGVSYPPVLFLVLALCAVGVRMLLADVERTRMELSLRRLTQRYALTSLRLRDIERELKARGVALPERRDGDSGPPSSSGPAAPGA